ncbi:MAG: hypothetical protein IPL23_14540 [Saprospiraceae bacterium]|nr:hypothetical protein [Saprospiraceae bacterium]
MNQGLGNSVEMEKLIFGFDRTVVDDLLNNDPSILKSLLPKIGLIFGLYFLISNFISSGIYAAFSTNDFDLKNFVKNGLKNYFPFLAISLCFYTLFLLVGFVLFFSYAYMLGNPFNDYTTEIPFFYSLLIVIFLFLVFCSYLWLWSIHAKFHYLSDGKLLLSLKTGFKSLMLNFRQSTLLLLFTWLTILLVMTIMNLLQGLNSSQSWLLLMLLILGMQITILLRCFLQFFVVGCIYSLISTTEIKLYD